MTPDEIARKAADAMWQGDHCSQALGFKIDHVAAGMATLSMTVRDDMLNGLKTCHGGMLFSLADSAFAFACNSYNQMAVAQHCSVSFIQPAYAGDVLKATAVERVVQGRSGIYDVTISRDDVIVAEFRGHSRNVNGQHITMPDDPLTSAGKAPESTHG